MLKKNAIRAQCIEQFVRHWFCSHFFALFLHFVIVFFCCSFSFHFILGIFPFSSIRNLYVAACRIDNIIQVNLTLARLIFASSETVCMSMYAVCYAQAHVTCIWVWLWLYGSIASFFLFGLLKCHHFAFCIVCLCLYLRFLSLPITLSVFSAKKELHLLLSSRVFFLSTDFIRL